MIFLISEEEEKVPAQDPKQDQEHHLLTGNLKIWVQILIMRITAL